MSLKLEPGSQKRLEDKERAMMPFNIVPVPPSVADRIRTTRDDGYGNTLVDPIIADKKPGLPCRICLNDAEIGEPMLLFSYSPFASPRPYRTVGPIFVHAHECTPYRSGPEVPVLLRGRALSVRAYDAQGTMVEAAVAEGGGLEHTVEKLFAVPQADHLHVHAARAGCFLCRIEKG